MKIKDGFVLREIDGTTMAIPTMELIDEISATITLSKRGKFIWEALQEDISIDELSNKLAEEYGLEIDDAKEKAEKFVNQLKIANILE